MPALYRMPIVYIVLLLIAAAYPIGMRLTTRATSSSVSIVAPEEPSSSSSSAIRKPDPLLPLNLVNDGILRSPEGLRRKVVIRDLTTRPMDKPEGGRAVGSPLDYFSIHYIRAESGGLVQIGPESGSARGWIPSSAAIEWETRLMARPTARAGRPPLILFRDPSCLLDSLAGRVCPRHSGRCPTEGEESSRVPIAGELTILGFPILATRSIPQPDGSTLSIHEVASLVNDQAPVTTKREPSLELMRALRRVNVAFVIDTTASMQATIESARSLAAQLVARASAANNDVILRMALVEYRDVPPGFTFKSRVVNGFTDAQGFRAALGRISAAKTGDGSVDEAVLDGVAAALPALAGDVSEHLVWPTGRAGELATKMIVLLGDAPDHARDLDRVSTLAARARESGITIASVAIEPPFALSRDERSRREAQWQALAEGSYRPLDKASGFATALPALVVELGQPDQLQVRLQALIDDRIERARELAALAAAEAEGRLSAYVDSRGLTLDRVAPVLIDLHRGETQPIARPDPKFAGKKAPSVRKGWVAQGRDGKPMITLEVLMSRDELDLTIRELAQLQSAISSDSRDLSDLLKIGTAVTSGEMSFLAVDRGGQTFAEHIRRRQGLPPARSSSLLARSQADLLDADDAYRSTLASQLQRVLGELARRRDSADWDDPTKITDGKATVPYELFDF